MRLSEDLAKKEQSQIKWRRVGGVEFSNFSAVASATSRLPAL